MDVCLNVELVAKFLAPTMAAIFGAMFKYFSERKERLAYFMGTVSSFNIDSSNANTTTVPSSSDDIKADDTDEIENTPVSDSNEINKSAIANNFVTVNTHSVIILNMGKQTAKNVILGHHILPKTFNIYPSTQYSVQRNLNGSGEIIIPTLVPNEQITISYLYYNPINFSYINSIIKSDEGFAERLNVIPKAQPSTLVKYILYVSSFFGVSFIIYWIIHGVIWLSVTL